MRRKLLLVKASENLLFCQFTNIKKITAPLKLIFILVAGVLFTTNVKAQYTANWLLTSNASNTTLTGAQAATVTVGDMLPGAGFEGTGAFNTNGYQCKLSTVWPTIATDGDNLDFPISPNSGFDLNITGVTFDGRTSGSSGPNIISLAYQIDGAGPWIPFGGTVSIPSGGSTTGNSFGTLNLTLFNGHTYAIRMYVYANAGTSNSRSYFMKNVSIIGTTNIAGTQPTITTDSARATGKYTAVAYGTITAGTIAPTSSGICWSTNANPSITDNVVQTNPLINSGSLGVTITGLSAGITYHVRSYVTTAAGTVYGNDITFTTDAPSIPSLTTVDPHLATIFSRTATSGGSITDSGGVVIIAKGIVFNTTGNPSLPGDNPTSDGQFATDYSSAIRGLQPSTLYYLRAYATNSIGTGYGDVYTFTTAPPSAEILVNLSSLSFGPVIQNNSSILSFTVSADILSPADDNIIITAPAGFMVSTSQGSGYASSITIPYMSGTLANTVIYVKFIPTAITDYSGTITITGGTAPGQNITVDGSGIEAPGNFTNKGTDFWVGYATHNLMYDDATTLSDNGGDQTMVLYFTSDVDANVTVSIPGLAQTFAPVAVTANTVQIFTVPKSTGGTLPPNAIQLYRQGYFNSGIHITSDQPIVAYAHIYGKFVSGASLLLPTKTWSTDYFAVSAPQVTSSGSSEGSYNYFFVVAKDSNTTIEITPTVNTYDTNGGTDTTLGAMLAGQTYTRVLNKGQIYNVLAQKVGGEDVTGSHIKTTDCTKQIAVFSGSGRTGIPSLCSTSPSSDNLFQQVFPNVAWGQKYLTSPTVGTVPTNRFRICVKDTSTNVTLNGVLIDKTIGAIVGNVTVSPLTANFYYEFTDSLPERIESDKPVMVSQYCQSTQGCTNTNGNVDGDPEMIFISPVQQAISNATLYSPSNQNISFDYINVIIPKAGVSGFTLDGTNVAYKFQQHPQDTGYYYAALDSVNGAPIQTGTHTLNSSVPFNAIAYGFGNATQTSGGDNIRESYGYNAGAQLRDLTSPLIIQNPYGNPINSTSSTLTTCRGTNFKVSATLPYQTNKITFSFFSNPDISPNNDTTFQSISGNIPFDSSYVQDGITFYIYRLSTNYVFDATGDYSVQITSFDPSSDAGCLGGSDKTISYTIHVVTGLTADFGVTFNSCASDTVQLTDQSSSSGHSIVSWLWSYNNGASLLPAPLDTVQNPKFKNPADNTAANFTLRAVNDIGCYNDVTKVLTSSTLPIISFTPLADICSNTVSFDLTTYVTPAGGVFSGSGVSGNTFNPANATLGVDTITYTYTIPAGCSESSKQTIKVNPSTALSITAVGPLCITADAVTLVPNVTGGTFSGAGISGSTFTPSVAGVGTHQIIYSAGGCASPDTIQIIVGAAPVVSVVSDQLAVSPGTTITLTGTSTVEGTYLWTASPAGTLSAPAALITTAQPGQTTLYTLTVTTNANCIANDTATVFITLPCLNPTKAFTPNGDGFNDKWQVYNGDCVDHVEVNVYNRWGGLVYHSSDYHDDWDGTYKGSALPDGTYYYVITAALLNGRNYNLTGNVTILR